MRTIMAGALALVLALGATGCSCSAQDKTLIGTLSAAGQGTLKDWPTLTDAQKHEAVFEFTRGAAVLDKTHNGRPLPSIFETAPVESSK